MISTRLKSGVSLSDLINFGSASWKTNSVIVTEGGVPMLTTIPAAWWTNPVVVNNSGGRLPSPGTVYLVTAGNASAYVMDADKTALLIQPGRTLTGPAVAGNVIAAANLNFLWIEGTIDASANSQGLFWENIRFSTLRNLSVTNAVKDGVMLRGVSNSEIIGLTSARNGGNGNGVSLGQGSNYNSFSDITVVSNGSNGLFLSNTANNDFTRLSSTDNRGNGLFLNDASRNRFSDLVITNNGFGQANSGIAFGGASSNGNLFNNGILASNEGFGILGPHNDNIFTNTTVASNGSGGISLVVGGNAVLMNTTLVANTDENIGFNSDGNTFVNLASAHAGGDGLVAINGLGSNRFFGQLKLGSNGGFDCFVVATTVCPQSDVVTRNITLNASFSGKLTVDDPANPIDTNGSALYTNITSAEHWTHFINPYRAWGWDMGGLFPNAGAIEAPCGPTRNCNIWDWTLASGDNVLRGVLTKPVNGNAANSVTHIWSLQANNQSDCNALMPGSVFVANQCESTFLRNAVEILQKNGNNNGLCESNENCLYTPNIGAYQGSGGLFVSNDFIDGGTLQGITLWTKGIVAIPLPLN